MVNQSLAALGPALDAIVARQTSPENADLRLAHHFLFALPIEGFNHEKSIDFILMGINPGESPESCDIVGGTGHEESFRKDFHVAHNRSTRGRDNWRRKLRQAIPNGNTILTELFFWSAKNEAEFKARFGPIAESRHLAFCNEKNLALIEATKPRAVIFTGFTHTKTVCEQFGLTLISRENCCKCDAKIAERHYDGERDWFFIPHLSASRGLTNKQRQLGRQFIERSLGMSIE